MKINAYFIRRVLMTVIGVVLCGIGVALCRMANFGVDPFQCMCSGIYRCIPLSQGLLYILINVFLLIFALIFDRKAIGFGTFINLFLLGYIIDGSEQFFLAIFGVPGFAGRLVWLALGIAVMCFSSSLYITAAMGISTYDFIAVRLSERKILPFRWMRIVTDLICVSIGFALGYVPGFATIILALAMGPFISLISDHFSKPLLDGKLLHKA